MITVSRIFEIKINDGKLIKENESTNFIVKIFINIQFFQIKFSVIVLAVVLAVVQAQYYYYPTYPQVYYPVVPGAPVSQLVLPPQAYGNINYVYYLSTWPRERQPAWFVNWQRVYNVIC